jgi:hypothetical protein
MVNSRLVASTGDKKAVAFVKLHHHLFAIKLRRQAHGFSDASNTFLQGGSQADCACCPAQRCRRIGRNEVFPDFLIKLPCAASYVRGRACDATDAINLYMSCRMWCSAQTQTSA